MEGSEYLLLPLLCYDLLSVVFPTCVQIKPPLETGARERERERGRKEGGMG